MRDRQERLAPIINYIKEDIMQFNVNDWRKMYDKIHQLGHTLRDSRPTCNEYGESIPAVASLYPWERAMIETEIKSIINKCSQYLDATGNRLPKPLWYYDRKDKQTCASHESFKYGHLLTY